jgi:hypothetical protein
MRPALLLTTATLLAAAAPAQFTRDVISPRGAEFFEGNSSSDILFGNWNPNTRVQQIDKNLIGTGLPAILYLGWRRNGNANAGAAKTTDLTIIMSHADYDTVTNDFASNYKDPPQTVFTRKPVNLPDWNAPAPTVPSPFDLRVPLDTPFIYNGVDALLWDVLNENNPMGTYSQDWLSGTIPHTYGAYPTLLGAGCPTPNGTMNHRAAIRANATTLDMGFRVEGAPSTANVSLLFGLSNPGLTVPGLCTTLNTAPIADLPLGVTDAQGGIALQFGFATAWNPGFAGLPIHTQALALDPSQPFLPVALSGGLLSPAPTAAGTQIIDVKRIYNTSSTTALTGIGPSVSAVATVYGL